MVEKQTSIADMVAEAAKHAPLVIVCATDEKQSIVHSKLTRVFLNGQDISRYLQRVEVLFDVEKPVGARLDYIGAAVIVSDGAELTLQQADVHVTCGECHKSLRGEAAEVIVAHVPRIGTECGEFVVAGVREPKED